MKSEDKRKRDQRRPLRSEGERGSRQIRDPHTAGATIGEKDSSRESERSGKVRM